MSQNERVLILCTGNSARSQMAEGLMRHDAGHRFDVFSAGVEPTRVRPEAIEVMREVGIDISDHRSKSVDDYAGQDFDYVITVCDNANERSRMIKRVSLGFFVTIDNKRLVDLTPKRKVARWNRAGAP